MNYFRTIFISTRAYSLLYQPDKYKSGEKKGQRTFWKKIFFRVIN